MKLIDLLAAAESTGDLTAADSARVQAFFAEPSVESAMPWYLHALVAFGAWISAGAFLGFFFSIWEGGLLHEASAQIIAGLLLIAIATAARRASSSLFLHQVCLAISVAGHVLTLMGTADFSPKFGVVTVAGVVLAAVLYPLYIDGLHRFLATLGALALMDLWIGEKLAKYYWRAAETTPDLLGSQALFYTSIALHCALIATLFLRPMWPRALRPLAYAATVSLLGLLAFAVAPSIPHIELLLPLWPGQIILTLSLLGLIFWAFRGERSAALFVALGAALLLGFFANPAILAALCLLILGFGLQARPLLVFGTLALPASLAFYYYTLQLTLAHKSLLLLASGAILLVLRVLIHRLPAPDAT